MIPDPCTTVAFTGHRTYCGEASAALAAAIRGLHAHGFRTFLCGMAVGFDLAAAEAVLELRDSLPGLAECIGSGAVSNTHLTLPTKLEV